MHRLKYFLDETDELIKLRGYTEMDIVNRRAEKIVGKLSDLISQAKELNIDHGVSPRSVRQWKKDVKARYYKSLDGKASEEIQVTGTQLRDFTTVRRPDINKLKEQYQHTKNNRF